MATLKDENVDFYEHCLKCELRKEVDTKLSIKVFSTFIASMVGLIGIGVTIIIIFINIGIRSLDNMSNNITTLSISVVERNEQLSVVATNQVHIMNQIKDILQTRNVTHKKTVGIHDDH